jgi:hypothetical protein
MPTETITCPVTFNSEYAANSVVKVVEFWTLPQESDEYATIYLESCSAFINLMQFKVQKFPTYDGSETETEKINKYYAAEKASEKIILRFLTQKQGWTRWRPIAEVTVLNPGRKQQLDFLPRLLTQQSVRLFDKNDALAVQLLDAGNGLIKPNDFIELDFSFSRAVEKKNNSESITNRIAILESAQVNLTHALAEKVSKTANETIGGSKTFTSPLLVNGAFPGVWLNEGDDSNKGAFLLLDRGFVQIQRRSNNFGNFEANPFYLNLLTGDLYLGGFINCKLPTSPTNLTAGTLWRNGNAVNIV